MDLANGSWEPSGIAKQYTNKLKLAMRELPREDRMNRLIMVILNLKEKQNPKEQLENQRWLAFGIEVFWPLLQ